MLFNNAKPFLKWAGGKTQLLGEISNAIPKDLKKNDFTYLEPFVGSGAVLFWMLGDLDFHSKKNECEVYFRF
jgi:DNA adenine methylase